MDGTIEYAKANDAPMAEILVPFSIGMALFGAIGVTLWRVPRLALGAIASFLIGVTPVMHAFWKLDGQEKEMQQIHFTKNLSLLGGAIALLSLTGESTDDSETNDSQ